MFDHSGKQIYLICGPTDMRKGTDGLSAIVNLQHICDSYESAMFIFCNRSRNRVKILEWDHGKRQISRTWISAKGPGYLTLTFYGRQSVGLGFSRSSVF